MKNLSHIISTYEEKFDEKFKCKECDKFHFPHGTIPENIKAFVRTFAADIVREAFEATKVENLPDKKGHYGSNDLMHIQHNIGFNTALSEVEARQQAFNEQPQ